MIYAKNIKYKLPALYEKQYAFVTSNAKIVVVESGTKTGKSLGISEKVVLETLNKNHNKAWWVAPVYPQAKIGFNYCNRLIIEKFRKVLNQH